MLSPVGLAGAMIHIASQQDRVYKRADKRVCMTRFPQPSGLQMCNVGRCPLESRQLLTFSIQVENVTTVVLLCSQHALFLEAPPMSSNHLMF